MHKHIQQLRQFHKATHSYWSSVPTTDIPNEIKESRVRIMQEELNEVIAAIYKGESIEDLSKELADVLYTVLGTVGAFGLGDHIEAVFDAVHESNMSKVPPDGIIRYNEHGKVVKPPTYRKPDLRSIFEKTE